LQDNNYKRGDDKTNLSQENSHLSNRLFKIEQGNSINTHRYTTRKNRNNQTDFELYLVNFVTVKILKLT
jgi:hypothetical protein